MKRLAALILTTGMLFAHMTYALGATDIENTKFEKPAGLLTSLGIIEGTDNEFGVSESISRGDFCVMLAKTFGYGSNLATGEKIFDDVDETSNMGKAIDVLYHKGYISKAENFSPERDISLNEAVKLAASALGAKSVADQNGGYPTGYLSYADEIGLMKNLDRAETLTKGDAVMMLYNALNTDVYTASDVVFDNTDNAKTLMYRVFKLEKGKGVITGTDKTKLYSTNGAGDGMVEIDNKAYFTDSADIYGFLGYSVDYWYSEEDGDSKVVFFDAGSKNTVTVINSENIVKAEGDRLIYENHYGRETAVKINKNVDFILNGKCAPLSDRAALKINDGTLTLIDNDNDNTADVIVAKSYINYVVSSYSNGKVYFKDSSDILDLDKLSEDGVLSIDADTPKKISEWTVLSVYADKFKTENGKVVCDFENSEIVSFDLSNNSVFGRINGKDEEKIIVDGVEYSYSFGMWEKLKNESMSNNEYMLCFDINNKLAAFDKQKTGQLQSGILGGLYISEEDEKDSELKIFNENGEWTRYKTADKITIDGSKGKREEMLNSWQNSDGGKVKAQFILFKTNTEGQITYIDTAYMGEKEDEKHSLSLGETLSRKYRTGSCTFEGIGGVNAKTKLYVVAGNRAAYTFDTEKEDKFKFYSSAKSYLRDNAVYYTKLYNVDDAYVAEYVLAWVESTAQATVDASSAVGIFDSINMGLNDEEEVVYNIKYVTVNGAKEVSEQTTQEVVFYKTEGDKDVNIAPSDLKKGDLIQVDSTSGAVGAVKFVKRLDTDSPTFGNVIQMGAQAGYIQEKRVAAGRVYAKNDTMYSIYYGDNIASLKNTQNAYKQLEAQSMGSVSVIVFDRESRRVEKGTVNDITDYISTGDANPYILVYQIYGTPNAVVVVR